MKLKTIYSSTDKSEISILTNLLEKSGIDCKVYRDGHKTQAKRDLVEKRVQVPEKDWSQAKEILDQTGFVQVGGTRTRLSSGFRSKRWLFLSLAALVLLIVAITIAYFMKG
jgi:hypothetical protein